MQCIEAEGTVALSLRGVARAAGVSHAAPYRHFADKQSLLGAVAEEGFLRLSAWITAAVARTHGPSEGLVAAGGCLRGMASLSWPCLVAWWQGLAGNERLLDSPASQRAR